MSRASRPPHPSATDTAAAVGVFLRALADRAEADPALAAQLHAALRESGLLPTTLAPSAPSAPPATPARRSARSAVPATAASAPALDPFAVLRTHGESSLRGALEALDLVALRQLVRVHRLDPARISARWSARERVIALIVDQVRARADHGKAFSRV